MLCPSCAAENPSGNAYCGKCGTTLNEAAAFVPRYSDHKRLVRRELAVLFFGVCALLGVSWLVWYLLVSTRSPANVVRAFIESDRSGQLTRQQEMVSNTWDSRAALTLFQAIRQQSGSSPFQDYRIIRTNEGRSNQAFVDVEVTVPPPSIALVTPAPATSGGNSVVPNKIKITVTFVLGRQGDEWKIDSAQTLASVISALAANGFQQFRANSPNFPNIPNLPLPPGWPNILAPPQTAPLGPVPVQPAPPSTTSGGGPPGGNGIL
jgi:hypothetical protein